MKPRKEYRSKNSMKRSTGFTLIEVMFSVVILGLMATGITTAYLSGLQSLDVQADRMLLDSQIRSRMEVLVATDFGALANGSEVVTVNGAGYTITWSVATKDLDGDMTPESNAKEVTVSVSELPGRTLTAILVNNEGNVGKI